MKMVTLKEFASQHHISYEAVRKSVVRYRDELDGHIITEKGSKRQYLDEEAQRILSDHRKQNPITIIRESHSDKLTEQAAEIESLKSKIDFYRDELIQLQKQQIVLLEKRHEYESFLEDRDRLQAEHDKAIEERNRAQAAAETANADRDAAKADRDRVQTELQTTQADRNRIEEERNAIQSDRDQARKELSTAKTIIRTAEGTCERLEKERDSAQAAYSRLEEERDQLRTELQTAKAEASSYHKSWFGFYRKG